MKRFLSFPFFDRRAKVRIKNIESFDFGYTCGDCAYANVEYSLKTENGGYRAFIKPDGMPEEEGICFAVGDGFVRSLEDFLCANKVEKWNHFNQSDMYVLDGNRFRLQITMADNSRIMASGYEKWPENYSVVADGIEAIFRKAEKDN